MAKNPQNQNSESQNAPNETSLSRDQQLIGQAENAPTVKSSSMLLSGSPRVQSGSKDLSSQDEIVLSDCDDIFMAEEDNKKVFVI